MSGFEVAVTIPAIVMAFTTALRAFRSWRNDRRERKDKAQNRELELSFGDGKNKVQLAYDSHFRRLGPKFAKGDGKLSFYVPFHPQIKFEKLMGETIYFRPGPRRTLPTHHEAARYDDHTHDRV